MTGPPTVPAGGASSSASNDARPLRFGVMCRSLELADWQASCVRALRDLPGVELALVIRDEEPAPPRPSLARRFGQLLPGGHGLWNAYAGRRVRRHEGRVDLRAEVGPVPEVGCVPIRRGRFSQYFSDDDVARVRAAGLDFILRFAFDIIRGEILTAARYGVWSFHHGDLHAFRGMPACFWELYHGAPVVGATLQRLTDRLDGGIVLKQGWFQAVPKSYRRTRAAVHLGSADFPARVVRDLRSGVADYLDAPPASTSAPLFTKPGNLQMLRFLAGRAWRRVIDPLRWLCVHEQWDVGRIRRPIETLLDDPKPRVEWMRVCGRGRFIADPFARHTGRQLELLFEDLTQAEGRGVISTAVWPDDGTPETPRRVYVRDGHLSYPFLLEHEGAVYCLPEMSDSGRVLLLRGEPFPDRWVEVATLLDGLPAIDPTLFRHEGRWWLLYTTKRGETGLDLHAAFAEQIAGPYTPHAGNPLKTDVRSARPAGTPFRVGDRLIRPAQDCGRTYGGRIALNEVHVLTPTRFEEQTITWIEPDPRSPYPAGVHTLSAAGPFTVIDGKRRLFVPQAFRAELGRLVRRVLGGGRKASAAVAPAEERVG